jgi:hypothetical protein
MASGAFVRSRAVMARYDVSPHMVKWWKGCKPDDGQITRHLSPFVQKPVGPWLKTFPKKMMDRAPYYIVYPFGTFAAVYLAICWTDAEDAKEDYEHRF